ncbi:DNA-packaging protein [Xenorhabdus bovienii]|uniref:DNA-packaging protein n=1 Tax=Xenorhabdus bovienii TaxID=40576 RepID=UPI00237C5D9E|nr:DNA-packaging protein [Xenorhabdus bovienii]MDE1484439.1 DNA-packaging protein [Xenorhabdus bovienii]MDE9442345.1 DNA-packaging protein [Xenorhabdus bovienii]
MAAKNKVGRPSKLAESLTKAEEYLMGGYDTVGDVVPSVAGLACYLGISRSRAYEYANQSSEFKDTLEGIKTLQENRLINKGLLGEFNATITKLMLSNHGYSEKQEVNHQSLDGSMSPQPSKIVLVAGGQNDDSEN